MAFKVVGRCFLDPTWGNISKYSEGGGVQGTVTFNIRQVRIRTDRDTPDTANCTVWRTDTYTYFSHTQPPSGQTVKGVQHQILNRWLTLVQFRSAGERNWLTCYLVKPSQSITNLRQLHRSFHAFPWWRPFLSETCCLYFFFYFYQDELALQR